ncbi:MAG: carbohydrate kinase family protein [bacterium]|nr:carbohydrate kinase family protein [bacterium]
MDYDFIGIGDTTIDAFIRLKEASVHCNINKESCEICMKFGDKIPFDEAYVIPAVGNSANAAVAAARLGLGSALFTNLGDDYWGEKCLEALTEASVSTEFVATNHGKKTIYNYVLWYEDDRTILVTHEKYKYELPDLKNPKWLYLSSMGEDALLMYPLLEKYLLAHKEIKLAFQPGTFQIKLGAEKLDGIYKRSELFICNKDESRRILNSKEDDPKKLLLDIANLGPRMVVITDGPKGAYAWDGKKALFMKSYPDPKPPFERTGAGDAFSSTVASALALGFDFETALRWGPINSMSVVQKVGAQAGLLTRIELEEWLKNAPSDYKPKEI